MKVSELEGAALDWAVAKVEGMLRLGGSIDPIAQLGGYSPSTDWRHGGRLIDEYRLLVCPPEETDQWDASMTGDCEMHYGRTALIAICRAVVAAKLGEEVELPAGLVAL